ncbi:hypothetical protein [Achromobacter xylosoxidans]|uniref:hypothetical protein n=1 Tax=Alcaligenes xylosoxydans xylosoxydans TaxID=85698 RepID=UPI00047E8BB2|nr:hypothetical protein [Achromobacter xylosoxidans]
MPASQLPSLESLTSPTDARIELLLRKRLRLARRIVEDEIGSADSGVVAVVFEQLCFRCDGHSDQLAH